MDNTKAWVFVSHSSADILQVRKVRNFLEERGAAPLLFHLVSLTEPEQFWPLIEREIAERNFFLLCDSENARRSEWVSKERKVIKHFASLKPIRVGRTDLNQEEIDYAGLEGFIRNLQFFFVGDHRVPAQRILTSFGFDMIGGVNFSAEGLRRIGDGSQMSDDMLDTFRYSVSKGWLVVILTPELLASDAFWREVPNPRTSRVMCICPPELMDSAKNRKIPAEQTVEIEASVEEALSAAARRMLTGGPDKSDA